MHSTDDIPAAIKAVGRRDTIRAIFGAVMFLLRFSATILGALSGTAMLLIAGGSHAHPLPTWASIVGLAGILLTIGTTRRRQARKLALLCAVIAVATIAATLAHIPWWFTWAVGSAFFAFFASTVFIATMIVLARRRAEEQK